MELFFDSQVELLRFSKFISTIFSRIDHDKVDDQVNDKAMAVDDKAMVLVDGNGMTVGHANIKGIGWVQDFEARFEALLAHGLSCTPKLVRSGRLWVLQLNPVLPLEMWAPRDPRFLKHDLHISICFLSDPVDVFGALNGRYAGDDEVTLRFSGRRTSGGTLHLDVCDKVYQDLRPLHVLGVYGGRPMHVSF